MLELDERVGRPERVLHFLAGDDLTRMPQQQRENLKGLVLERRLPPALAQFSTGKIRFEYSEADLSGNRRRRRAWRACDAPSVNQLPAHIGFALSARITGPHRSPLPTPTPLAVGKVQAPPGCADRVVFLYPDFCERCGARVCIEMCSGQALTPGRTACRPSTARNASSAARVYGTAGSFSPRMDATSTLHPSAFSKSIHNREVEWRTARLEIDKEVHIRTAMLLASRNGSEDANVVGAPLLRQGHNLPPITRP